MSELIKEEELREWLNINQRARLIDALDKLRIPYHLGGGGVVCTTQAAIDHSLIGTPEQQRRKITFSPA